MAFRPDESPTTLIVIPLLVYFIIGMVYSFVQADFVNGFYIGCVHSCSHALQLNNGLGANIFGTQTWSFLQTGDFIGFFTSLGLKFLTSASFVSTILNLIGATIAMIFALGVSGTAATLGYTISDATVKMAQAFAVGLFIWTAVTLVFGAWTGVLGFGMGIVINFALEGIYVYGLYWRGSSEF